jgi:hypothetical protein
VIRANTKLPVVEVATICATALAMYHMYLRKTGGLKYISRAPVRTPEGTVTETETIEWFGSTRPLTSVTSQLTGVNPAPISGCVASTQTPEIPDDRLLA